MFDIGIGEVFVLLAVALLVFGPDRLPEMAKQGASFVRDLRTMVANARKDLSGSVGDLGIDKEDLKTLSDLRNPRSFVRQKVLDGVDFGLDDDGDDAPASRRVNGSATGTERVGETVDVPPPDADVPPPPEDVPDFDTPPPPMEATPEPHLAEVEPAASESESESSERESDGEQVPVNAEAGRSPRFDPDAT